MIYYFLFGLYVFVALVFVGISRELKHPVVTTILVSIFWPIIFPIVLGMRVGRE